MKLYDMIGQDVHVMDADQDAVLPDVIGTVDDVLVDLERLHLLCLRVQTGTAQQDAPLLLGLNRLQVRDGVLCTTLDQTALDIAHAEARAPKPLSVDPARLPAILTGPFGNTVSPRMAVVAMMDAQADAQQAAEHPLPDGAKAGWRFLTTIDGASVFGTHGQIGQLTNISVDWQSGKLIDLRVQRDAGETLTVDADTLAHLPKKGGHLVTRSAVEADPDIAS